jgi:hypothetical protein
MRKLVVTGLTGDMHRSDRCRPQWSWWPGDPGLTQLLRRWVIWRRRLWETKHISINKSFMYCDQVWNEPHRVLNWTKCLVREIQNL